jgi:hypothetical protein
MFLSSNPFSQLNLSQDLNLRAKRRRRGSLRAREHFLLKVLVEWNEWATVRNEEGAIHTQ